MDEVQGHRRLFGRIKQEKSVCVSLVRDPDKPCAKLRAREADASQGKDLKAISFT
jgi:hypothetical protein